MSIYEDDAVVGEITRDVIARGHRIFQIFKLGDCDTTHTRALLNYFKLPAGARVLDVGCGVGEVAARMKALRPDLRFTLSNVSASQLALCPADMPKVCAPAEALPFDGDTFDAILVLYTMGHTNLRASMKEYARCLAPRGTLCVYDMTTEAGDCDRLLASLSYQLYTLRPIWDAAMASGLQLLRCTTPRDANVDEFMDVMPPDEFKRTFAGIRPLLAQFRK